MSRSRRIGLMGGTFDPIHCAHLLMAERAREAEHLDEVWFIPTYLPPHKSGDQGATPEERREMVRLAIEDHPAFRLETIELDRGGVSFTLDTAAALTEREPDCSFFWIIGADMVMDLPNWHEIEKIAEYVMFIGMQRPGYPLSVEALPSFLQGRVRVAEMPALDISSTQIRERCRAGRSIRYLVPEAVRRFIAEKGLYK